MTYSWFCIYLFLLFDTGSHCVAQADLEPPVLMLQSPEARIVGVATVATLC
jgi:hypothetical protein